MITAIETSNKELTCELIKHNREVMGKEGEAMCWIDFIRETLEVKKYSTLLDVACHDLSITRQFSGPKITGIDKFEQIRNKASQWCEFKCMDMRDLLQLGEKSYDVVLELDSIEHLDTVMECDKLVWDMEKVAKHLVIHMTPMDVIQCENWGMDAYRDMPNYNPNITYNPLQAHKIQLSKEYFLDKGYEVKVVGGDLKNFLAWKKL